MIGYHLKAHLARIVSSILNGEAWPQHVASGDAVRRCPREQGCRGCVVEFAPRCSGEEERGDANEGASPLVQASVGGSVRVRFSPEKTILQGVVPPFCVRREMARVFVVEGLEGRLIKALCVRATANSGELFFSSSSFWIGIDYRNAFQSGAPSSSIALFRSVCPMLGGHVFIRLPPLFFWVVSFRSSVFSFPSLFFFFPFCFCTRLSLSHIRANFCKASPFSRFITFKDIFPPFY